jgi:hypothetical protein
MSDKTTTTLNIRDDRPTAIASKAFGSRNDVLGFNITFLALRNPKLAVQLLQTYSEAHQVQKDDPEAPEEDFALYVDALAEVMQQTSDEQ